MVVKASLFLAEPSSSPSRTKLGQANQEDFPRSHLWTEYSAIDRRRSEKAAKLVSGKTLRAIPDFSKAKRVLSLDAIFF